MPTEEWGPYPTEDKARAALKRLRGKNDKKGFRLAHTSRGRWVIYKVRG